MLLLAAGTHRSSKNTTLSSIYFSLKLHVTFLLSFGVLPWIKNKALELDREKPHLDLCHCYPKISLIFGIFPWTLKSPCSPFQTEVILPINH